MAPSEFAELKGARCLVTGGTGMIGWQVCRLLHGAGARVVSVSLDQFMPILGDVGFHYGDLRDLNVCQDFVRGKDTVFHVAGVKASPKVTRERPASFYAPLLQMNAAVLGAAMDARVERLVYVSSVGAYARRVDGVYRESWAWQTPPMDLYPGWAKRAGETFCAAVREEHGLDWAVVRPGNVYGEGDNFDPDTAMVIPSLMARAARGGAGAVGVWGDGSPVRDFLHAEDCARGIVLALLKGTRGSHVNLGGGDAVSIKEMVALLCDLTGMQYEFAGGGVVGQNVRVLAIGRARNWLGWEPRVGLREGLERTWTWFLEHREDHLRKQDYFKGVSDG